MTRPLFPLAALVSALTVACGPSTPPLRIKASDPSTYAESKPGQPLIVEFLPGDVIPLNLLVQGDLVETSPPPPPIALVAKQRFFLKIDGDGVRTSPDGENWNASHKKGSFKVGLEFQKTGAKADVVLVTPSYAEKLRGGQNFNSK